MQQVIRGDWAEITDQLRERYHELAQNERRSQHDRNRPDLHVSQTDQPSEEELYPSLTQ